MNSSWFLNIAHLSDFHYDPHYAPGSSSDCKEFICCRNSSQVSGNLSENYCSIISTLTIISFALQRKSITLDNKLDRLKKIRHKKLAIGGTTECVTHQAIWWNIFAVPSRLIIRY